MIKLEKTENTGSADRVKLVFSDGTSMRVPTAVYYETGLVPGSELSEEALESLADRAGLASAKNRAVRILAASVTSGREMRRKLIAKGESAEHAEETISWLEDLKLLDDSAAAKTVAERAAAKGYGPNRIRDVLFQKGFPKQLWAEAMSEITGYEDSLMNYLTRHISSEPDEKEIRKLTDALYRRGFTSEQIRKGFDSLSISQTGEDY